MSDASSTALRPVYLSEYRPAAFTVEAVDLRFDLDADTTRVTSTMQVRRRAEANAEEPLILDGEDIELRSLRIDGDELDADAYRFEGRSLVIPGVPAAFELTVVNDCHPAANTTRMGLYIADGTFCSQCEPEGFRRITYFIDRPDNMAVYSVTLVADAARYPVLLSNGNPLDSGSLPDGRHWARWHDPFPKPSYLFALVAGALEAHEDRFTTASGREVTLRIYTEAHNRGRTDHAMASLKKAMRWDEETFGLEYDLDLFQIVSVDDFNMGAMENKGLNIFNSKLVLADADTATDNDFQAIESVIAHEYFHNWTGNRVTCRDWFQLSLKEGLTVFRDQQFTADMHSAPLKRIEDVRVLRSQQFPEDNGPMAHPVRPDHYIKIDNFYTLTVYEKGAEVIRMLYNLVGADGFRRGMDLYFRRHDGQAVTCDDFVAAMADATGTDLDRFKRWYHQAGTPRIRVEEHWDHEQHTHHLTVHQSTPPTADQPDKQPLVIPLRMGLLDGRGRPLPLKHGDRDGEDTETVLPVTESEQTFVFREVRERPTVSLLRNFSAPVIVEREFDDDTLRFLVAHDTDAFNRWDSAQTLVTGRVLDFMDQQARSVTPRLPEADIEAFRRVLNSEVMDDAMIAATLTLPGAREIGEELDVIDPDGLYAARDTLVNQLAEALEDDFGRIYRLRADDRGTGIDAESMGRRRLKNLCLGYLGDLDRDAYVQHAVDQVRAARNMTDVMGGLRVLADLDRPERDEALGAFYDKWHDEPLVTDKWLTVQATSQRPGAIDDVERLMAHPAFDRHNPNRIRALVGAFAMGNFRAFHAADGRGYRLLADFVMELDPVNPQIASGLVQAMIRWRRFDARRQGLMKAQLERVQQLPGCSDNTREVVDRALAPGQAG
ncbi:aminopeptidase N [Aquisalimonas lutea]|uniref:aminopeptidase N n=1 Tax=Aquisalimonas lutea TaxID=1327750 RepID=UPI0025B3CB73|nr:aminopeptidase N [Aquisalimonas lutea]MDN3518663.1 aminopeptidase N [Aquisalimonas lutea]